MFVPIDHARVFACPPGADFPKHFVQGFLEHAKDMPQEQRARIRVLVNAARMRDRIAEELILAGSGLMPRLSLVTDLADLSAFHLVDPPISDLRRILDLRQLVSQLADVSPELVPHAARADLAESLDALLSEMEDEGVAPEALRDLDVSGHAEHWARVLKFINIVTRFAGADRTEPMGPSARIRYVAELLIAGWQDAPPADPIIIAGSTGSRGTTSLLMRAVARLPQGALVLPGFDFESTGETFVSALTNPKPAHDHPQYRFADLLNSLGLHHQHVQLWGPDITAAQKSRNRLVSLALRPAPVTHQWQAEAPALVSQLPEATEGIALIECDTPSLEALSIAVCIRRALEEEKSTALITPDSELIRRVSAQLVRWNVIPDNSMGQPLLKSPSGRLFRLVLRLAASDGGPAALLSLLKHPLVVADGRGDHLTITRKFELYLRKKLAVRAGKSELDGFVFRNPDYADWADWVASAIPDDWPAMDSPLAQHLETHLNCVDKLVRGPDGKGAQALWAKPSGERLRKFLAEFSDNAEHGGHMRFAEYAELFETLLRGIEARDPVTADPRVMIWGTLEARVLGADHVILGGLNDGVWPAQVSADPWLNRAMREASGLLSPERKIGLSAHDFQQAIAARDVVLTRAIRDNEAETVPSRWLNRLTNLMQGMEPEEPQADTALGAMRQRGERYLELARKLDLPPSTGTVAPAPRPAPVPPRHAQPRRLSVTEITRLIRDPYFIYARHVLRLRPLDPLGAKPDNRVRGNVLHDVLAEFLTASNIQDQAAEPKLRALAAQAFDARVPWPETRLIWLQKFNGIIPEFVAAERVRQIEADILAHEVSGRMELPELEFALTCKADRIDGLPDGAARIWDYKTGEPPIPKDQKHAERQLFLEALLLSEGGFENLPPLPVSAVGYLRIGSRYGVRRGEFSGFDPEEERRNLVSLLGEYLSGQQGYVSRRLPIASRNFEGDYDHLARYGEWQDVDRAERIDLT